MSLNLPGVRLGDLRHVVTLQRVTRAKNATTGNDTETWADWKDVRAAIMPSSGREFFSGRQVVEERSTMMAMYYQPINAADYRVKYTDPKNEQTRIYGIRSITAALETRGLMMLACEEIDPA